MVPKEEITDHVPRDRTGEVYLRKFDDGDVWIVKITRLEYVNALRSSYWHWIFLYKKDEPKMHHTMEDWYSWRDDTLEKECTKIEDGDDILRWLTIEML